jgi:hypothetical protein
MPIFIFCVPCLSLILYFLILGIFFPSKRKFIKDAINCFWKKVKGKYCPDSFDDLTHKRFVMWLSEKNFDGLARFFVNKRNFDLVLVLSSVIFIIIDIWLFILLLNWIFIKSPCEIGSICRI